IHANDAKKSLGSRVDRHEHIGQGEIGREAFARLLTDPRLLPVPVLVETPDSETMHAVNLALLRRLAVGRGSDVKIVVYLFGHYSDYFGGQSLDMTLPEGTTVGALATLLGERDARLKQIGQHCRFAVNEEYVALETVLTDGCTVAVLPPMSGG